MATVSSDHLAAVQGFVGEFARRYDFGASVDFRCVDLASEVGELCAELTHTTDYGRSEFAPTVNWRLEMGDILFSLLCLANESGIAISEAFDDVIEKYEERERLLGK